MIKDYDNDDDLDEGHVQPLLEMSQDCIVEWNESQNVSDFATTPIPESSPRGTIGLDDVRRNLDVETNDKGDEEINAFFHLLRKEHEGSPVVGTSPSRVATQRTKNTHKVESYIERPKKTSLASRRRRRQQQSNTVSNKRPHRIEPTGTVETICKTPPPNITEGAFDSLLKQLKQSAEQITPQPTADKEISTLVLSTSNCSNSPLKEIAIVLPDARKETAPLDTQELIHKHAISGTIEKTSQQVEKQVRSIAVTATSQPSDGLPRLAARPDDLPTSHPSESTTNKALLPATSIITEASTRVPYNNDDDEFGNFAFDDIDMTCLDNLLSVKSSQHVTIHSEKDSGPSKSASTSEYSLPHASTKVLRDKGNQLSNPPGLQIEPKPTVRTLSQQPIIDDEFGEFPDFDFEVVEQAIANRQQTSDPLHNEVIQNPRNQSIDPSGLLHIKFSRYKVIQSEQDSIHFRKTLLIAEWTDEMRREHEEETKIHRNCQVEVIPDDGKQESQPVNLQRRNNNYPPVGHLQLRGQWYYTAVEEGDIIHICSLAGRYRTDASALPLVLHSHPPVGSDLDDLVIVHHPDLLMTPTVISETVSCPRRAVFKQRNGSTGLTSKSALIGTLRHALFGVCMKERNFEKGFVVRQTKKIVRENADAMLGCGVTTADAEKQLIDTLPILLDFVKQHTTFMSPATDSLFPNTYVHGHVGGDKGVRFVAHATYSIEEPVVSPELALKGYVDAVLETTIDVPVNENDPFQLTITGLKHSLMALELKTGHNQASQHTHMGQLSLYTLMLQGRYGVRLSSSQTRSKQTSANKCKPDPEGAASGGLLLYLNEQSSKATHVAPEFDEFKSLIGQRNIIAAELVKSSRPRGVLLRYEEDKSKDEGTDQM